MNRWEWCCRYRWCGAHGACHTQLTAFVAWLLHNAEIHPFTIEETR